MIKEKLDLKDIKLISKEINFKFVQRSNIHNNLLFVSDKINKTYKQLINAEMNKQIQQEKSAIDMKDIQDIYQELVNYMEVFYQLKVLEMLNCEDK